MPKLMKTPVSRRTLLKAGAFGASLLVLPYLGSRALAQPSPGSLAKMTEVKGPEGLVSFNAGWFIPLEDKPALLSLEDKKIKEAEAASAKTSSVPAESAAVTKHSKTWSDKFQDVWIKAKSLF